MPNGLRVRLTFPETLVKEPLLGRMVREFDVLPNIRRANVEEHAAPLVMEPPQVQAVEALGEDGRADSGEVGDVLA